MSKFLHNDANDDSNAKAIAIPRLFSENSSAKNAQYEQFLSQFF